jgi:hypothetical protein
MKFILLIFQLLYQFLITPNNVLHQLLVVQVDDLEAGLGDLQGFFPENIDLVIEIVE